jgi:ubiquinone/menaquinone biosynthesis C-methylase UbiE
MSEFYDPIAYDETTHGVAGDVDFFMELAKNAHASGLPVLELACGTGRVAIPIAREGVRVVGLDMTPAMLDRARQKSADLSNARWVEGSMQTFALEERFGLTYIPFRSFQHLLTVDDQLSCLRCVRDHLVPGGRFALDIFNPDIIAMGQWMTSRSGTLQRRKANLSVGQWETRSYRTAQQLVETTFVDEKLSDEGAVMSRIYRDLKLRYTFRYEMEHLLLRSGFEIEALFGDCFGSAFEDFSPEMIWVARRPG